MKLYTANYDANRPSTKAVTVPLDSAYGVGVKLTYNGRTVPPDLNNINLDGLSADEAFGDMAVFRRTSLSAPSTEEHEIKVGMNGDFVFGTLSVEGTGNQINISVDIPQFADATFYYPGSQPLSSIADVVATPFQVAAYKADGTSPGTGYPSKYIYCHDNIGPGYSPAWGTPVLYINTTKAAGKNEWTLTWGVPNADFTLWVPLKNGESVTIPPNCYYYCRGNMQTSVVRHVVDTEWKERIERTFKLQVNNRDLGVVEGYGDDYVFKNTVNLSGTYEDGTDFSFDVPIVEE